MSTFAELGLAEALVENATAIGWDLPLPIQRAAIPVLRRGGNAVLRAGHGAGVTGAYGLALLDRLAGAADGGAPRALVVVATDRRAAGVASVLARLGRTVARASALTAGWNRPTASDIVVGSPGAIARELRSSLLKLGALEAVVLDGAESLLAPDAAEALDTVLVSVPADAQRVLTTPVLTREVERFVDAHVRRAITIPPRPAEEAAVAPSRGTVAYLVVTGAAKEPTLARLLQPEGGARIAVRGPSGAAALRELLRERGYDEAEVTTYVEGSAAGASIAFDVPPDADSLAALQPDRCIVLVEPGELPHLRSIATDARIELRAHPAEREAEGRLTAFREEVRRALREEDVDAQLLLLEPLFDEASPAEVAAALSALLRRRAPVREPRAAREEVAEAPGAPARPRAFVRLYVGIGQKDGARPADIVGAFTGEAGITGEQVGRIEIRETFSVVEVDPAVADRVIRALNGTTMRGRSVRVDYDRKSPLPGPQRRRTRPS